MPLCAAESPPVRPVDYAIVVTGSEILAGAYADTHTHFITRTLHPLGWHCAGSITVDDRAEDIKAALRFAAGKGRLVIVTGGLGPTDNDVTRQALSEFTGIALREHPEALAEMERRFNTPRDQLRPNLRRQVRVPERGGYLKNASGTAVGLVFESPETVIVALPGPPRELQPMVRDELVRYLHQRFGTRLRGASLTLRFVGLGQSQIDHAIKQHLALPPDVTTSSQFEGGRVDFTFSLPDDSPSARRRLDELKQQVLAIQELGDCAYAVDEKTTLEAHVERLLAARGAKLAVAEVASGGSLGAGLAGADGAGSVLAGAYLAPSEDRLRRLLAVADDAWSAATQGPARLELLANATARATGSQWVVVVGEAREDADGSRYVDVAFKSAARWEPQRIAVRGTGETARSYLATQLLDQLRRRLR
jgi:nicotinamide-nucleotide amidase